MQLVKNLQNEISFLSTFFQKKRRGIIIGIILSLITIILPHLIATESGLPSNATTENFHPDEFLTQYFWREVITLSPPERPKIVLVLSGGGARGLAHIGVLKVLKEEGVPIDAIVGCSVGALVGALYCAGMEISKLERIAQEIGWTDLTDISPLSILGLILIERQLSTEKMEKYIKKHIGNKQFYELKIPFATVATDIKTGEKIIFQSGDVALAARASATIPGVFSPVEYRHRYLVDGGLVDNIPVSLAKLFQPDIIIAVDITADYTKYSTSNMMLILNQSIYIQGGLLSRASLNEADIVINPHVSDVAAYELWRAKECIDAGIIATRKSIPKLKREIMNRTFKWLVVHN